MRRGEERRREERSSLCESAYPRGALKNTMVSRDSLEGFSLFVARLLAHIWIMNPFYVRTTCSTSVKRE